MTRTAAAKPRRAPAPAPVVVPFDESDEAAADTTTGEGLHELVAEMQAWRAIATPAFDAVAGFGARLDALCAWFKGKWPWLMAAAYIAIQQVAHVTPEGVADGAKAVAAVARAISGGAP
ncbi:MAG: hypothetical protein KIS90_10905 [Phenylobacterium sp.]|nr:hypothetical protein [Phenylobacterium sp.]